MSHSCLWSWSLAAHSHPHAARFTSSLPINTRSSCTFILINNYYICGVVYQASIPSTLGLHPVCAVFPDVCVCVSVCLSASLFRLALGGQPFNISNDVPRKSVSRATRVPNTLPAASGWCVLCLHFSHLCEDVGCSKQTRIGERKKKTYCIKYSKG